MKYFLLQEDNGNRLPFNIDFHKLGDARKLLSGKTEKGSTWNIVKMKTTEETFFPAVITHPFPMVSKECLETMVFYQPEIKYKLIKLLDSNAGRAVTYFMPIMPVTDCLSERTEYTNKYRMCIKNIVLVREKIIGRSIIRIDDKEYIYHSKI